MKAAALALAACAAAAPAPARTAVVRDGDVVDRVLLTGALHPVNAAVVFVPTNDQPSLQIRWLVADGTVVKAGDKVAELDATPFRGTLADLHGQLTTWESSFKLQEKNDGVALAGKALEVRRQEIERERAALHAAVPADIQLLRDAQQAQLSLHHADISLTTAKRDLASTTSETALNHKIAEINRDKMRRQIANAEDAMAKLELRAPRDGIAVVESRDARKFHVGDAVQSDWPVVSMPDLAKPMEVTAELSDVDDGRVEPNLTGTCTPDAYPSDPIACTVETISPVARPLPGHDALRRSFGVTLALGKVDAGRLRPGMAFEVELHRPSVHALVVPRGAVFAAHHVMMATGEVRVVELGPCDAQQCAVVRGLAAGDVVAVGGAS